MDHVNLTLTRQVIAPRPNRWEHVDGGS